MAATTQIAGIGNSGAGLAYGATDVNFLLISAPAGVPTGQGAVVVENTYTMPNGSTVTAFPFVGHPWNLDGVGWRTATSDQDAKWIGIQKNYTNSNGIGRADPSGEYIFEVVFTLPDQAAVDTARINGRWSADNRGDIYMNGIHFEDANPVGGAPASAGGDAADNFMSRFNFDITSGFVVGTNHLQFRIYNQTNITAGNPVGFLVRMDGYYGDAPEPATMALIGIGLGGIFLLRRRVKKA